MFTIYIVKEVKIIEVKNENENELQKIVTNIDSLVQLQEEQIYQPILSGKRKQ